MNKILLVGLAFVLVSAGCLGFGEDSEGEESIDTQERAEVTEDTGGIQGTVTDPSIEAVEGATVTIEGTGEQTQTALDGSFAFSELSPDTYTLTFDAEGFLPTDQSVEVTRGEVTFTDVVLTPEPSQSPYMTQYEFNGFIECSVATPVVLAAVCSIPNFFVEGNATNDRFIFDWFIEPDAWQFVTEMEWEDQQPLAEEFRMIIEPGISNEDQTRFAEETGPSPLYANIDRERIVEVDQILDEICEGEREPEGALAPTDPEVYCGYDILEEGALFHTRVFVDDSSEATLAAAIQQPFTHYVTTFHHAPACEDYSILRGNECPQEGQPREDEHTPSPEDGEG